MQDPTFHSMPFGDRLYLLPTVEREQTEEMVRHDEAAHPKKPHARRGVSLSGPEDARHPVRLARHRLATESLRSLESAVQAPLPCK